MRETGEDLNMLFGVEFWIGSMADGVVSSSPGRVPGPLDYERASMACNAHIAGDGLPEPPGAEQATFL